MKSERGSLTLGCYRSSPAASLSCLPTSARRSPKNDLQCTFRPLPPRLILRDLLPEFSQCHGPPLYSVLVRGKFSFHHLDTAFNLIHSRLERINLCHCRPQFEVFFFLFGTLKIAKRKFPILNVLSSVPRKLRLVPLVAVIL